MMIYLTKEDLQKLEMLSQIGDYYIDDMEPTNSAYEDDKETITQAQDVLQMIQQQFLNIEQMEEQENLRLQYLKSYRQEINKGL